MSWIIIKTKDIPICKTIINKEEDSMGVINGQFIPLEGYEIIRQLIKEYSKLIVELSIEEAQKNRNLIKLRKGMKELCLSAYNDKNEKLDFSHIDLRDFSDELGSEGYSVLLYK